MVEKMVSDMVECMLRGNLLEADEREHYIYAGIGVVERFLTLGSICIIGIATNNLVYTILFLVCFLSLRKRTGGYHAPTFLMCYCGTILLYLLITKVSGMAAEHMRAVLILLAIAIGVILLIGTVNHPNMHMNAEELSESKKASRRTALLEGGIIFLAVWIQSDKLIIIYMSLAVILCAILMCIAKIIQQEEGKT